MSVAQEEELESGIALLGASSGSAPEAEAAERELEPVALGKDGKPMKLDYWGRPML